MKAKLGALVTEAKGSLGGHTIQNSRGGVQLRNKPIARNKPSACQYSIRSNNAILHKAWSDLTPAQRQTWNDYAIVHSIQTKGSDKHTLSGQAFFLKAQGYRLHFSLPLLSSPFEYRPTYFGPELIQNGNFVNSDHWILFGGWSISAGKAYKSNITTNPIRQTLNTTDNSYYVFVWTQIVFSGTNVMRIYDYNLNDDFFRGAYDKAFALTSSRNCWYAQSKGNHTQFNFIGYSSGNAFCIFNLSLKEVIYGPY